MNQTLQVIKQRYACKSFTGEIPPDEKIQAIAQAAIQAPSAVNAQPWQIVVVRDKELIGELESESIRMMGLTPQYKPFYDTVQSRGIKLFFNAPCMIVIPIDKKSPYSAFDCGIVSQTISLAAQSLGVDSCIIQIADVGFSGEKGSHLKEKFNFPEGYEFGLAVLLGNATEIKGPHRPDPKKITFID